MNRSRIEGKNQKVLLLCLKTITLYRDGSNELSQKNKFEAIEPGSNPAILGAEVCGEKHESPAAAQGSFLHRRSSPSGSPDAGRSPAGRR